MGMLLLIPPTQPVDWLPASTALCTQSGDDFPDSRWRLEARLDLGKQPFGFLRIAQLALQDGQVKPGASLSLQMHHHRAEHWIVVKGIAEITNGDKVITLNENQSTYIPQGQTHRLANPGRTPLEIIEVQSGSYLGEDDIVRFEDTYGRK